MAIKRAGSGNSNFGRTESALDRFENPELQNLSIAHGEAEMPVLWVYFFAQWHGGRKQLFSHTLRFLRKTVLEGFAERCR